MAKSALDYAKEQLGDLDLSYLDKEKEVANKVYNASKSSLENNFNNLMNQINQNRADTRKNFNTGRTTIAENAFNQNRLNNASLASRGVGLGGLKDLGEVGNRIETGRQYSNLANEFYSDMANLNTTEQQGRSQYDIDQKNIENTLNQTLAGIDTRKGEAKNSYNMVLGQLAEQIQGRWDSNANAQAALKQQQQAAAQAHADALKAAEDNYKSILKQDLTGIINNNNLSQDDKVARIASQFGVGNDVAVNVLKQLNQYDGSYAGDTGYNNAINYLYGIVGGW